MTRSSRIGRSGGQRAQRRQAAREARKRGATKSRSRPLRLVAFAAIVIVVGGAALWLVAGRLQGPPAADASAIQVRADMGGFRPPALSVRATETVRVEFASLDTPFHSDGGGWHQFAIDELGIDWKVGPQSSSVFEFTAPATPGEYTFYCDICCGGKENPSMQGTLTVRG